MWPYTVTKEDLRIECFRGSGAGGGKTGHGGQIMLQLVHD